MGFIVNHVEILKAQSNCTYIVGIDKKPVGTVILTYVSAAEVRLSEEENNSDRSAMTSKLYGSSFIYVGDNVKLLQTPENQFHLLGR